MEEDGYEKEESGVKTWIVIVVETINPFWLPVIIRDEEG